MLLDHIGLPAAAATVEAAVAADLAARVGREPRRTAQIGDSLAAAVSG
jgi:3-isopropylmalate dehydrogenase